MPAPRKRLAGTLGLGLVASGLLLTPLPAQANTAGTDLVISEVYGAGGFAATSTLPASSYANDFIELYNPTDAPVNLSGWAVFYGSPSRTAGGSVQNKTLLTGSIPARGYYLVAGAGGTTGAPLPAADTSGALNLGSQSGLVVLSNQTENLTLPGGNVAGAAGVVDAVGYGTANTFESAAQGTPLSGTASANRSDSGSDTDRNNVDLTVGAPSPRNSSHGQEQPPPAPATEKTIAEVQGTNASSSPLAGQNVIVEGVVTAVYATGGYDGFYLQTLGTGGADDATPGASDGVFIDGANVDESTLAAGDRVEVTGSVNESFGLTQVTAAADGVVETGTGTVIPLATAYPRATAEREAHEGELLAPTGPFTVTDSYETNRYGEIVLAAGTTPLVQPTEIRDAQDTAGIAAVKADNEARMVTLDDGTEYDFGDEDRNRPMAWLSKANPVRVGAPVTFTGPVVLDYRFGQWKFEPTTPVEGTGASTATFANTRTAAPEEVGGDIRLATFNVLNYFPTTGEEYVGAGLGTCSYYTDRAGARVTVNSCNPSGPRGAANQVNLERQRAKSVAAIRELDASIVSLEEIENSAKFGKNRDFALKSLVDALNAAEGSVVWAYVASPTDRPALADEDVIRTAFIYKPADVRPVGQSMILKDEVNFDNAREPLAQAFKKRGAPSSQAFGVIVNHFKSKGSGVDDGTGQGNANPDRIGQANALADFASTFAAARAVQAVFLAGDFNAYSMEDPMQVLYAKGYEPIDSEGEETYTFDGLVGSLDHVLGNAAALEMVTGADVWNINSVESVGFEYSRHNYNATDLYSADPYKSSDHDPEIVGLDLPGPAATARVNLLNINDFHGRIDANTTKFATTVEQLRDVEGEDHTLLLSAGDNIGASLFASASQQDNPTIDVLNALGLETSAVGNHELDGGFADLTGRVDQRAEWTHLAANIYEQGTTTPALDEYELVEVDGVTVGVIGAITQETPSLVSPAGVASLDFGDPVDAVNRVAARLSDGDEANGEADVLVAEYHEGAGFTSASTPEAEVAAGGVFAKIVNGTTAEVDAIFTGHTHKMYAYNAPVPGEPGSTRPVLQTGSYGENIGQIVLDVDRTTGEVTAYSQRNVARVAAEDLSYPRVQQVKAITDKALADAAALGNQPIGQVTADITTAFAGGSYVDGKYAGGTRDDRAEESTLGDLVANALRDGVSQFAQPDLGLTNPGGLRAELLFAGSTASNPANADGVVTYAEANAVLPFNNTVAIVRLTGAQLRQVLEQQWQTDAAGNVPARAYLQLGLSDNVRVTADPAAPRGSRITSIHIDDEPIDPAETYTVSTLSFLAAGGDNFRAFAQGRSTDTGLLDAQMWREYLAANKPLSPDFARQQVVAAGLPQSLRAGEDLRVTLSKLDLTSLGSPANTVVEATGVAGGSRLDLGSYPVANGTSLVALTVPGSMSSGGTIELVASPSGTRVTVPVQPSPRGPATTTVSGAAADMVYGSPGSVSVTVTPSAATGTVTVLDGSDVLGSATLAGGEASVALPGTALEPGTHTLTIRYAGDASHAASTGTVTVTVAKASSTTSATATPATVEVGGSSRLDVTVAAGSATPTGTVEALVDGSVVDSATLVDGRASLQVGPFGRAGDEQVVVRYLGDEHVEASSDTVTIAVIGGQGPEEPVELLEPTIKAFHFPERVVAGQTRATLTVKVRAEGTTPTGWVRVQVPGKGVKRAKLDDGVVKFDLPKFGGAGRKVLTITYNGDDVVDRGSVKHVVWVVRKS